MDFSEKDAARSKWKLTQKHSRGRGRGGRGAGGRGGGRGGGRAPAGAVRGLGTNEDRYHDEAAEQAAAAALLGPVQQSQGADLAELLSQAEPFDQGYYYRTRVNLTEEFGLPPEAEGGGYQGLTLDLKGLAACLELLPKNQLLDTDAFSDEEGAWAAEEGEGEGAEELPDLPGLEEAQGAAPDSSSTVQQPPAAQRAADAAAAAATEVQTSLAVGTPASGSAPDDGMDDLLSELPGKKATISSAASSRAAEQQQQQLMAAGAAAAPGQPAAANHQMPMVQQAVAANLGSGIQQQLLQQQQAKQEHDAELDMLLGLTIGHAAERPPAAAPPGGGGRSSKQPAPQAKSQSLEDWLEGL